MADKPYDSISAWRSATGVPQAPVRSPSNWAPIGGFVVQDSAEVGWVEVLASVPGRKSWTIANTGPNPCQVSNKPQTGGALGVTIAPGGVWSEETEDSVVAFCPGGTTLDVSQTYTPLLDAVGGGQSPGGQIPFIEPLLP